MSIIVVQVDRILGQFVAEERDHHWFQDRGLEDQNCIERTQRFLYRELMLRFGRDHEVRDRPLDENARLSDRIEW